MTTFLFWNVNNQPLGQMVADIAHEHKVDVIALAESSEILPATLLQMLNATNVEYFYVPPEGCIRIALYTRFTPKFIPKQYADEKLTVRTLELPGLTPILFVSMHLASKRDKSGSDQLQLVLPFIRAIQDVEQKAGHSRTVIVGDLNMNPFDEGIVGSGGFHAVMDRSIASKIRRTIDKKSYTYFYNPMWSLMGDWSAGPPGTYHYSGSRPNELFWHMFDQVLVRPELLDKFRNESLIVLERAGNISLISQQGKPQHSDHLPLLFSLQI